MFRFLYATDLHGWTAAYHAVVDAAVARGIDTIVNGGDMLPKEGRRLEFQQPFIEEFLPEYLDALAAQHVAYYGMFGNDDMQSLLPCWREVIGPRSGAHDLTERWHEVGTGLILRGCCFVPDTPFGLKDWSVLDTPEYQSPEQWSPPVLSRFPDGFERIDDLGRFLHRRPTLAEMLEQLAAETPSLEHAILVIHAPPAGTGQGLFMRGGQDIGSRAVREWIERRQPLLTLHGHVHESPAVSGVHTVRLGRTICHQPGQMPLSSPTATVSLVSIEGKHVRVEWLQIDV